MEHKGKAPSEPRNSSTKMGTDSVLQRTQTPLSKGSEPLHWRETWGNNVWNKILKVRKNSTPSSPEFENSHALTCLNTCIPANIHIPPPPPSVSFTLTLLGISLEVNSTSNPSLPSRHCSAGHRRLTQLSLHITLHTMSPACAPAPPEQCSGERHSKAEQSRAEQSRAERSKGRQPGH